MSAAELLCTRLTRTAELPAAAEPAAAQLPVCGGTGCPAAEKPLDDSASAAAGTALICMLEWMSEGVPEPT